MIVHNCDQYSPEWFSLRRGRPTASEFSSIITPVDAAPSKGMKDYICRLIGDRFDPMYGQADGFASAAMKNGSIMEPHVRRWYQATTEDEVTQVGFCTTDDGRFGCSPDALVGEDGILGIKAPEYHTHVGWLIDGVLPAKHKPQTHGELVVTGRAWFDFMSECPGLPPLLVRVFPDDYTEALRRALDEFWTKYQQILERFTEPAMALT